MKKASMKYTLILTTFAYMVLNMAHPVTPRLIKELSLPSYMFGVLFATMSLGNLLFSPLWGKLSDKNGRVKYMIIGILGYGISQLGFGFSKNPLIIILFRFLAGAFVVSFLTIILAYTTDINKEENRLKALANVAAASTIGTSMGSFLGGVLGNNNYKVTFLVQFIFSIIVVIGMVLFIKEPTVHIKKEDKNLKKGEEKAISKGIIIFVMIQVALFYFASTSYNSSVNYFIETVLNMPPRFNGLFLSIAGIIGFGANVLFTSKLEKLFGIEKSYKIVTLIISIAIFSVGITKSYGMFFLFALCFVAFSSIYVPLQQNIVTTLGKGKSGRILGIQNSSRAVGMVLGSLYSGYIFDYGSGLPFITAGVILFISFLISIYGLKGKI